MLIAVDDVHVHDNYFLAIALPATSTSASYVIDFVRFRHIISIDSFLTTYHTRSSNLPTSATSTVDLSYLRLVRFKSPRFKYLI